MALTKIVFIFFIGILWINQIHKDSFISSKLPVFHKPWHFTLQRICNNFSNVLWKFKRGSVHGSLLDSVGVLPCHVCLVENGANWGILYLFWGKLNSDYLLVLSLSFKGCQWFEICTKMSVMLVSYRLCVIWKFSSIKLNVYFIF